MDINTMYKEYERQDVCIYKQWILENLRWRNTVGSCSVCAKIIESRNSSKGVSSPRKFLLDLLNPERRDRYHVPKLL